MTAVIVGLVAFIVMWFVFTAYMDEQIRRTELKTYVGAVMTFEPHEFYVNYHNSEPVSGIDTVLQYKSKGEYMYTFVFETQGVIRVMVNEKKCMALLKYVNIVREDDLYRKLYELKNKLIEEDK